jgi:TRAP-type uncharacterized transport system substrate-binding protein
VTLLALPFGPVSAQSVDQLRSRINQGHVGIMCGRTTGSFLYFCEDMAVALNDNIGYTLRVVPMIGEGSVRNVEDVLYLRGVDLALAFADTLDFMQRQGIHPSIKSRLGYVTAMHGAELHLIGLGDIGSIEDLAGKKVNFSTPGTGTFLTMTNIFEALGINVEVQSNAEAVALERLKRGEIAAMALNAGTPWKLAANIAPEDGLKLIDVPVDRLSGPYEPVTWTAETYPGLITAGETVTTSRVRVVPLAYQWPADNPRCAKVKRFAEALRTRLPALQEEPFQAKWRNVDMEATVSGLDRWRGDC